ncbi:MAG: ABC transporter ATP-binding protein [Clostridia bacterium]|nr:ABC transporter ATP-binding protein [Clostridia bacterium]MBR2287182.1 ABC transporter ATP-binding protein [Clostridia bacterium]
MLKSNQVTRRFGNFTAVDHVTMTLEPGHVYAMLGPNGSGKTTWMKMASGLMKPTEGEITFRGEVIGVNSRRHITYMSTEPFFYTWMTVRDVGKYYADFFDDFSPAVFDGLLTEMELSPEMKTRSLSSGMAAKLKIAATLARDADIYILDEPFNGIDLLARDEIRRAILRRAEPEKMLILSSHLVEEMEAVADIAIFMHKGKLIELRDLEEMRQRDGISMADRYRQIYGHVEVDAQ